MSLLPFPTRPQDSGRLARLVEGYSVEVMPRTAARIDDFGAILPAGTRVYIAHIEGTPIDDMIATAARLQADGYAVMPHIPARIVPDRATLDTWLQRYAEEAGVTEALVIAGGPTTPHGDFDSSMQLLETGLFDRHGFDRLHVAGHPEGNRDIDRDGSTRLVDEAASWKSRYAERTDAHMAMVTQFAFDAEPVLDWARRLDTAGVDLPIHVGVAGPTKLHTLIKYAVACGVGPSLSVLKRRARDLTKLAVPFEPTEVLEAVADAQADGRAGRIERVHVFPLGGIRAAAAYAEAIRRQGG
jgi:methylenetetrahydrofolate reductase (NADPH)